MSSGQPPRAGSPVVRVLLVEVSLLLGERLARLAHGRAGVTATIARTLADAHRRLDAGGFDVVAVDVDGAGDPGVADLAGLRAAAPRALLVALTGDAEPETVSACRSMGADLVVPMAAAGVRLGALLAGWAGGAARTAS